MQILEKYIQKIICATGYEIHKKGKVINDIRLAELKNIYRGERAFVIGSGPSLSIDDLDRLKNEITFACNKIYLAFDETDWRPTYYTVLDSIVAKNCCNVIRDLKLFKIFSSSVKHFFSSSKDILWLKDLPSKMVNGKRDYKFSKDLLNGIYGGFTVIYTMLQIAFYMGIKQIYLLGIDFSFEISKATGEKTSKGENLLKNDVEINHFHPNYRKQGELWTMPRLDIQYEAFKVAKMAYKEAGRFIANASRKTKLDVFPIVDFDNIVP